MSLQYRVVLILFLILLALGIPGAALIIRTEQQAAEAHFRQSALTIAELLRGSLEQDMMTNSRWHLQASLAKIGESSHIAKVLVISNSGQVGASSELSDIGKTRSDPEVASVVDSGEALIRARNDEEHGEVLEVILPVRNEPDCYACHDSKTPILGAIEVALNTQPITLESQRQVWLLAIIGGLTLLLVGVTLTYVLRRAVIKPLVNQLENAIDEHEREEQLYLTGRLSTIGELVSGIAHELNNPLTGIIGFSELLLDRDVPEDIKEDLRTINKEAQRSAQIVRNLLTFARKHPEVKQSVNVNEVILRVLELRAYEQRVNNIQVVSHLAPELPEIQANPFQLQQVFINIIINAEYFMIGAHSRGTLTITTGHIGNMVRASFADDGPGIPPENLEHVFDPFFTTKEVGKGTGLGLSICHGIVTEHGGRIYAESELGEGATFIVELPISKQ